MKALAIVALALALAGCANYDRLNTPLAYQEPAPSAAAWHKVCENGYCKVELHTRDRAGDDISLYAGYNGNDIIVGLKTPPASGGAALLADGRDVPGINDLGCDTTCKTVWVLKPAVQKQVFAAQTLEVSDPLTKHEIATPTDKLVAALHTLR